MKVLINGINGKMGQEVANVLDTDKDILLIGGVDKENTGIYTYPVYTNASDIEENPISNLFLFSCLLCLSNS